MELGHTIGVAAMVAAASVAMAGGAASAAPGFACESTPTTYTVQPGDSWYGIAQDASVSGPELLATNGVTAGQVIRPGDVVCLPAGAAPVCAGGGYTVVSGDSWYAIASRAGVSGRALLDANGATADRTITPGDVLCLPAGATAPVSGAAGTGTTSAGGTYTVRSGDSWFAIANRADVSAQSLLDVNGATTRTVLVPGQRISLPAGADTDSLANGSSGGWVNLDVQPTQGPCWYGDTWMDARSEGRRHEGVDIFTVRGQYVYAVVDGRLSSRIWDQPGLRSGNAWWLTAADGSATFFYAHLLDFAPGLRAGSRVEAGQIIGFVGDTGNAAAVHLHFEIHPGGGEAVDPYPMVKAVGGCRWGTPYEQPGGWTPERVT